MSLFHFIKGVKAEDEAQWAKDLPTMHKALNFTPSVTKTECGGIACNLGTWVV